MSAGWCWPGPLPVTRLLSARPSIAGVTVFIRVHLWLESQRSSRAPYPARPTACSSVLSQKFVTPLRPGKALSVGGGAQRGNELLGQDTRAGRGSGRARRPG